MKRKGWLVLFKESSDRKQRWRRLHWIDLLNSHLLTFFSFFHFLLFFQPGSEEKYELLHVLEFTRYFFSFKCYCYFTLRFFSPLFFSLSPSCLGFLLCSTRKRMSVIMRTPSGKIRLYCKGAVSLSLSMATHDSPTPPSPLSPLCLSLTLGSLSLSSRIKAASYYTCAV